MTMSDPLGDMLTRIRNAQMRGTSKVSSPASKVRGWVLDVLKDEGYILGYLRMEKQGEHPEFDIELKYYDGAPVITEIKRVSKPGRRVYQGVNELPHVHNGLGISIVSTPKGIMSDSRARDENVGGEVLCSVY